MRRLWYYASSQYRKDPPRRSKPMVVTSSQCSLDWARPFALFSPLNKISHEAVVMRLNRHQRVNASRYHLRHYNSSKRRTHCLAKVDFRTILGRSCASLGASRASSIKLPRAQGICSEHLQLHFDLHSKALLLTDTSKFGTYVRVGNDKLSLLRHQTVEVSSRTYIKLGTDGQFEFNIEPTMFRQGFDRLFDRWIRSFGSLHPGLVPSSGVVCTEYPRCSGRMVRINLVCRGFALIRWFVKNKTEDHLPTVCAFSTDYDAPVVTSTAATRPFSSCTPQSTNCRQGKRPFDFSSTDGVANASNTLFAKS
jgi:hypothetical protein